MDNNDKIKAIKDWQSSKMHHLTCGNCRKDLFPALKDGEVILNCECGYIQNYIPDIIFEMYKNKK